MAKGRSDDDVYYYIRWRLKLEGETEKMGVSSLFDDDDDVYYYILLDT